MVDNWDVDFSLFDFDAHNNTQGDENVPLVVPSKDEYFRVIHKRKPNREPLPLFKIICDALAPEHKPKAIPLFQHLLLELEGKRNIKKNTVHESNLSVVERYVYQRIKRQLQNTDRRERVMGFINKKNVTKRLVNYFTVHYSLLNQEFSYYLDKRAYPYKIIGQMGVQDQPEILELIRQGARIIWINFHQEYKNCKSSHGRRNLHAPYRRSVTVTSGKEEINLCELNFYLWFDEIGGIELFQRYEDDVRKQKALYELNKRLKRKASSENKQKKKKIVMRNTSGVNYTTHAVQVMKRVPQCNIISNMPYQAFLETLNVRN